MANECVSSHQMKSVTICEEIHRLESDWAEWGNPRFVVKGSEPEVNYTRARNYRPSFRENKPNTLVLYDWKRSFWACFRENWVYKFGHRLERSNKSGEQLAYLCNTFARGEPETKSNVTG
jgi:hypothetical protein